eukprot:g10384.t1
MGPKKSGKKWQHYQPAKRRRDEQEQDRGEGGDKSEGEEEQRPKKPRRAEVMSIGNVKGHQAVVGTCDVRNDRQATAELVDLLNSVADDMYPTQAEAEEDKAGSEGGGAAAAGASATVTKSTGKGGSGGGDGAETGKLFPSGTGTKAAGAARAGATTAEPNKSVEEMIREEAAELRSGTSRTHPFKSVNTSVKGVVMVCVMDPKIDIVRLVDALYDEIRTTKTRRSRFLERVTPLQVTTYSELEEFKEAAKPIVSAGLPPVAEGVPPLPVVVRATVTKAGRVKVETGASPTKETPEAAAAVAGEAANAETGGTAAAGSTAVKNEADGEKQAAPPAAATSASGSGTPREEQREGGSVLAQGKEVKTSDKRWKFRVDIRRRHASLDRLDLINAVVGSVGEGHSVSMSSPEVTIAIEAVKSVVGTSVLFNYALNHEYSISRLQDAVCGAILDS